MRIQCGFCRYQCSPADLYSHVMADHSNTIDHLKEEIATTLTPGTGPQCNVLVAGQQCSHPAIVVPQLTIPALDRKTLLCNPTVTGIPKLKLMCPLCGDHALAMSKEDVLKIGDTKDMIEQGLGQQGLMPDWLKIELTFVPLFMPPMPS